MNDEFKKSKINNETRYTLESMTAGATGSSSVATATGSLGKVQKRGNILAQEKKETPKPRNFVAKNAKMGGAGHHKDKKKAVKQGDVKHKKPLAESSYAEDLAKQVFDANPNIKDENAVLDAAWPIAVKDLGNKRAMSVFNYDQDFPSDLVSVYGWLQKDQQGVAEGLHPMVIDDVKKLATLNPTDRYSAYSNIRDYFKTDPALSKMASDLMGGYYEADMLRSKYKTAEAKAKYAELEPMNQAFIKQALGQEQGVAEGFNGEYDDEAGMAHTNLLTSARAVMGLLKTIDDKDNLPEWVQEKIAKAEMMLVGVWDYLQSQKEQGIDPQQDMEEASSYHNNRTGFSRGPRDDERHDLDPTEWYIVKDGKMLKTTVYPNQVQKAIAQGFSPSREEAKSKADNVEESGLQYFTGVKKHGKEYMTKAAQAARDGASQEELGALKDRLSKAYKGKDKNKDVEEAVKKGLYYYVNKRKKAGTSRPASSPKAPSAQAWKDAAKTAKKESADPYFESLANKLDQLKKK